LAAPDVVAQLLAARRSGAALPAFPTPVPTTLAEAYAVQQRLTAELGAPVLERRAFNLQHIQLP
jgi:2-keto-4-pentenoate hydratase